MDGDDFMRPAKPLTPLQRRLVEAAAVDEAQELLFQHTVLCQTCLPYRDPGGIEGDNEEPLDGVRGLKRVWERATPQERRHFLHLVFDRNRVSSRHGAFSPMRYSRCANQQNASSAIAECAKAPKAASGSGTACFCRLSK